MEGNSIRFVCTSVKVQFLFLMVMQYPELQYIYDNIMLQKLGKKKGEIPLRAIKVIENVDERMLEHKENAFQVKRKFFFCYHITVDEWSFSCSTRL